MSATHVHKVDELGRIIIPNVIRKVLNWKTGTSLIFVVNETEQSIRIFESPSDNKIDELGRVVLPCEIRSPLNWELGLNLEIQLNSEEESITLFEADVDFAKTPQIRKMDDFGRVVFPTGLRKLLNWESNANIMINLDDTGKSLVLTKEEDSIKK
ncbi:MAG: AbrB/MazE/SpoVT family DNA-binding domain-containing protein [Defluviitaleaceae bacterium]|nr:AbrB/MazE/SpoVT family DNA-binding domain-containing protein [Defluviitaleaceae bacterium]